MAKILYSKQKPLTPGKRIIARITVGGKERQITTSVVYDDSTSATLKACLEKAEDEAEDVEIARRAELHRAQLVGTTLADLAELVSKKDVKKSKAMNLRDRGRGSNDWFAALYKFHAFKPQTLVNSITSELIADYQHWAQGMTGERKRLANRTINKHVFLALRRGIRLALEDVTGRFSDLDTARLMKLQWERLAEERREEQHPALTGIFRSPKSIERLCKCLDAYHVDVIKFVLGTGLRKEELMLVTRDMLHLPEEGGEYKGPVLCLPRDPFGHTARTIPLMPKTLKALERIMHSRGPTEPLFERTIPYVLRRASLSLSPAINPVVKLRDLRHCYGTFLGKNRNNSLKQIAVLMGNSEQSCVKYLHSTPEWTEAAVTELTNFIAD